MTVQAERAIDSVATGSGQVWRTDGAGPGEGRVTFVVGKCELGKAILKARALSCVGNIARVCRRAQSIKK